MAAGTLVFAVLGVLWVYRERLAFDRPAHRQVGAASPVPAEGSFDFLRIPAVWMCFGFFFLYAVLLGGVQTFAPEAARHLHGVPVALAAMCLTFYMVCSAGGMVAGGFLASNPARCERVVGIAFGVGAMIALLVALAAVPPLVVPVLFALMGFASGIAAPSRDLLVKKSTPDNATGRVYGVVYSGLDIGQAIAPLIFGVLMDRQQYQGVWLGLVALQAVLIGSALSMRRARRTALAPA